MSDRQKKRYVISALNGMEIEAVGARGMKAATTLFSDYRLKVRYIAPDKNVLDNLRRRKDR